MTLPARRLVVCEILGRVGLLGISVLAHVRVGIFFLIEVTKGVVDLSVLALICTDWGSMLARGCLTIVRSCMLTVEEQVLHCAVALRHVPVLDRDLGNFKVLPLG